MENLIKPIFDDAPFKESDDEADFIIYLHIKPGLKQQIWNRAQMTEAILWGLRRPLICHPAYFDSAPDYDTIQGQSPMMMFSLTKIDWA